MDLTQTEVGVSEEGTGIVFHLRDGDSETYAIPPGPQAMADAIQQQVAAMQRLFHEELIHRVRYATALAEHEGANVSRA